MTWFPVHGPDLISSPVLFPRNQTGNYDTPLLTCHSRRSHIPRTRRAGTGHVEAHSAPGNLAGKCCC
jgi:hypothetical protein